jgi:predicted ATP-grasp superfamily ATP-dependent carboligase
MIHNTNSSIPVLIFGDGITAYGIIRALSPYGIKIYMVTKDEKSFVTKSRFVNSSIVIDPNDENFVASLKKWVKNEIHQQAVLMVTEDLYLDILAKQYDQLLPEMKPTFPDWSIASLVRNKCRTLRIAKNLGIPIPQTKYITSQSLMFDLLEKGLEIQYPVLIRPERSNIYKTRGILCKTSDELITEFRKYNGFGGRMLLQEYIPGGEENLVNVSVFANSNEEPIAIFMNRKRRSLGKFGPGTLVSSTWSDDLSEYTTKLIKKIGFSGYSEAEFKFDKRDGKFKLIEINGRISMLNSHALRCGINLPYLMYMDAINRPLEPMKTLAKQYPESIIWWNLPFDIVGVLKDRSFLKPITLVKQLQGKGYIVEPWNLVDPAPFLFSIYSILREFRANMKIRSSKTL